MGLFDALAGIGGSLLGAGADIYGANMAADASKKAGKLQWQQYLDSRKDFAPWREAGVGALGQLSDAILKGDFSKFFASPGYQYRMDQGTKAVQGSAAARGALESGATLKALNDYGQNQGSAEYGNWLNNLYGLAGYGRDATSQTAQLGANAAAGYGNRIADAGAMRGSGYAGAANNFLGNMAGLGAYRGWW